MDGWINGPMDLIILSKNLKEENTNLEIILENTR